MKEYLEHNELTGYLTVLTLSMAVTQRQIVFALLLWKKLMIEPVMFLLTPSFTDNTM